LGIKQNWYFNASNHTDISHEPDDGRLFLRHDPLQSGFDLAEGESGMRLHIDAVLDELVVLGGHGAGHLIPLVRLQTLRLGTDGTEEHVGVTRYLLGAYN
jgi:hypothetical protein